MRWKLLYGVWAYGAWALVILMLLGIGEAPREVSWPDGGCSRAVWISDNTADHATTVNSAAAVRMDYVTADLPEFVDTASAWAQTTDLLEFCNSGSTNTFRAQITTSAKVNDLNVIFTWKYAVEATPVTATGLVFPGTEHSAVGGSVNAMNTIVATTEVEVPNGECIAVMGLSSSASDQIITQRDIIVTLDQVSNCR